MLDGAAMTALEMIQEEDKAERTPRWTATTATKVLRHFVRDVAAAAGHSQEVNA